MTVKLVLRSLDDIKKFRQNLLSLKLQMLSFQAITLRRIANEVIVDEIHRRMRDNNISEKIINGTVLENIEIIGRRKVRLFFKSEYFAETGFDVRADRG